MNEMGIAINELHQKAMNMADEAFYAKRMDDLETAQSKYLAAYDYERGAAMLLVNDYDKEPSRSVLFRSAANLLLNLPYPTADQLREAERLVAFALSGNPPVEIAGELREAWQKLAADLKEMEIGNEKKMENLNGA